MNQCAGNTATALGSQLLAQVIRLPEKLFCGEQHETDRVCCFARIVQQPPLEEWPRKFRELEQATAVRLVEKPRTNLSPEKVIQALEEFTDSTEEYD